MRWVPGCTPCSAYQKMCRSSSRWRPCWGVAGLGMLAQRSELVVMQASGFTRMQVALSVMKTAIPLVLLTMAIGEWVAPQGEQMARNYRAQAMYGGSLLHAAGVMGERWSELRLYRTRERGR